MEKTKVVKVFALAISLLLSSCSVARDLVVTHELEEEILEAVFRYQLEHCYTKRSPGVYFLSRHDQDLSDSFMEKFKGHRPPVRKRSQMVGDFMDKESGVQGIILDVEGIKWARRREIEVEGACVAGRLDGHGYLYRVVRERDRWVVHGSQGTWIS
jgi:hypothetical protein